METLKTIWDFFQNEVLGMNWLNRLIETFLNTCGLDTTGKIGGSIQFFIYDIISFCMVRNSAISISRTGLGGIACSRIRFCRKSFALFTILRNRPGSQPLLLIDWLAFSCISVRLTSKIFASEIPDNTPQYAL